MNGRESRGVAIGVLDTPVLGFVDAAGTIELPEAGLALEWAIYTDEWRTPNAAPGSSTRQQVIDAMPVVETRVAVPSGDVVQRVYATTGKPAMVVIEIENASPGAIAVAVRARGKRADLFPDLVTAAPSWREVEQDDALTSLIWPLPHTASMRATVPVTGRPSGTVLDPRAQPSAGDVARGWVAQLARGARLEIDDDAFQH